MNTATIVIMVYLTGALITAAIASKKANRLPVTLGVFATFVVISAAVWPLTWVATAYLAIVEYGRKV